MRNVSVINGQEPTMTNTFEGNPSLPVHERYWFKIVLWILYSIIFVLGVGGNAAVCFIMYRRKTLRTVTNLFILNLAVSDLIFSSSIPLELPLILNDYKWPYASFFCKIYSPVQTTVFSVSIFTLSAVSITRHRAINHPFKRQVSLCHAHYIVLGIWILSTLIVVPHFLTLKMNGNQCHEEWPGLMYRKIYTTLLFAFLYIIPLFIIVFTYMTIVKELMKKRNCNNSALVEAWHKETIKIVRMFFKVTVVFVVCNLPSQLMWLWLDFGNADQKFTNFWALLTAFNILIFANSVANPFIYYICHDRFRSEAQTYLPSCRCLTRLRRCCARPHGYQESLGIGNNSPSGTANLPTSRMIEKTQESYV